MTGASPAQRRGMDVMSSARWTFYYICNLVHFKEIGMLILKFLETMT